MIEKFQISNFKGFNEPLKIDIAPITLIFGPNSAGKSSISDSLQMIKYSGPNSLQTYLENKIDLGSNEEILSRQNTPINKNIEYAFTLKYPEIIKSNFNVLNLTKKIKITKNFKINESGFFSINKISIFTDNEIFFSIDLTESKSGEFDYECKLNQFLENDDKLKEYLRSFEYYGNKELFSGLKNQIKFIIDNRKKDLSEWKNKKNKFENELIELNKQLKNVLDYSKLMDEFYEFYKIIPNINKKNKELRNILNIFIENGLENYEIDVIFKLLLNIKKPVKISISDTFVKEFINSENYDPLILDYFGENKDSATIGLLIENITQKLKKIYSDSLITKTNNGYIWDDTNLKTYTIPRLRAESIRLNNEYDKLINLTNNGEKMSFTDQFADFDSNILMNYLDIINKLILNSEKLESNRKPISYEKELDKFNINFFKIIKNDFKNNYHLKVEAKYKDRLNFKYFRNKNTFLDFLNISIDNFFPNIEDLLSDYDQFIEDSLNEFTFVSCYRNYDRVYRSIKKSQSSINDITNSTADLVETLSRDKKLLDKINSWFEKSTLQSKISIEETSQTRTLNVFERGSDVKINIADAGSGIRNLIPIIAVSLYSETKQNNIQTSKIEYKPIIGLEEPEVNLHPRLQIDLASFIADFCRSKNFLIETHSEIMMRKIQQLIRDKNYHLSNKDVKVYCVRKNSDGHYVDEIKIDEDGKFLDKWPHGFFKERSQLL